MFKTIRTHLLALYSLHSNHSPVMMAHRAPRNFSVESFDPEVLREYDIRGIVGNNLNNNTAYTIGRTFGQIVQKKLI